MAKPDILSELMAGVSAMKGAPGGQDYPAQLYVEAVSFPPLFPPR